uniref:Huntingtin interacting protein K n=1 Tax=Strigops habroptila TaxID=2489341 RepID=A0A672U4J9_STRHB
MAAEGDVELELETEPNGGGGGDGAGGRAAEKPRKHDSGAADLERVTDYAEEKEIQSSNLETVRAGRDGAGGVRAEPGPQHGRRGARPGARPGGRGVTRPVLRSPVTLLVLTGHVGNRRPEVPGAESETGEGEGTGKSDHQEGGPGADCEWRGGVPARRASSVATLRLHPVVAPSRTMPSSAARCPCR